MDSALVVDRLQFAFTITYHYLFPQLTMGLALADRRAEDARAADRQRAIQRCRALLGADLRDQLRVRRGHRHPDGVPVRHELGALLEIRRRRDRADAGDGRDVRVLPRIGFPRPVPVRREAGSGHGHTGVAALLVFLGSWLSGYFIVATDAWMQHPVGYISVMPDGTRAARELRGAALNPWVVLAVRAHHERRGDHRRVRDGGGRRVLRPAQAERSSSTASSLREGRRARGLHRSACCSSFRPAIGRGGWSPTISRPRWRRWKGYSRRSPGAPLVIVGQPDMRDTRSTIRSRFPGC